MRHSLKSLLCSILASTGLLMGFMAVLTNSYQSWLAAGAVYCVVPPDGPSGPFVACDQVFSTIQTAVDTAVGGEEIWVATGIYTGVHTRTGVTQLVYLDKNVTVRGGYTTPFDTPPDPVANPTILDAQQQGRVVYVVTDTVATLVNLDITGGNASGLGGGSGSALNRDNGVELFRNPGVDGIGRGVGLYPPPLGNHKGTPLQERTPRNPKYPGVFGLSVTSSSNADSRAGYSVGWGGGIFGISATVTISHTFIYSNIAETTPDVFGSVAGFGGGVAFVDSHVMLLSSTIRNNIASREGQGVGGGVGMENSSFYLEHNWVLSNTAVITSGLYGALGYGGGVALGNSSGEFHGNQIVRNVAVANGDVGSGGGIYAEQYASASERMDLLFYTNQIEQNVSLVHPINSSYDSFGQGGGILLLNAHETGLTLAVTMENNLIQYNTGTLTGNFGLGGGLLAINRSDAFTFTFKHNDVVGNVALVQGQGAPSTSSGGLGGGLAEGGVSAHLENNRFISNTAVISGDYGIAAALYVEGGHFSQRDDIMRGNVANVSGARESSIVFSLAEALLTNVVIADNGDGDDGGAVFVVGSEVTLLQPTIARNGGERALYIEDPGVCCGYGPSTLTVTNAVLVSHTVGLEVRDENTAVVDGILWYNTPVAVSSGPGAVVNVTNQVIGDPKFAADGYHITAGSAAIRMGVPAGVMRDIDGEGRPLLTPSLGVDEYWPYHQHLPFISR